MKLTKTHQWLTSLLILVAHLFAPGDSHLLQFAMAELGIRTNRKACRLREEKRIQNTQGLEIMKPNSKGELMQTLVLTFKVKPLSARHG